MKLAIDSPRGRQLYSQRIATVEPVFANIRHNKRLSRFTLRGRAKVSTQCQLYCLEHNIEKLAHTAIDKGAVSAAIGRQGLAKCFQDVRIQDKKTKTRKEGPHR